MKKPQQNWPSLKFVKFRTERSFILNQEERVEPPDPGR